MKNYVVIPGGRQAGLFSYVLQALHNLSVIDGTDDKLYIKYKDNMLYLEPAAGDNVWDYYFHQPFSFTKEDILNNEKEEVIFIESDKALPLCHVPRKNDEMFKRGRYLTKKYIKVKHHITDKVDGFIVENFDDKKFFAIHKRGTDHGKDAPLMGIDDYIAKADEHFESYDYGLICTDEQNTIDIFKKRYGNKIKFYDSIRCDNDRGVHYSVGLQSPYKMGEDVIVESLLMSKSDLLIRTVSGVTDFSIMCGSPKYLDIDLHVKYNK
tara:strand:- start:1222 stop:2019 length:798 start_codon:yes stop_codon:yes gene_type:complete